MGVMGLLRIALLCIHLLAWPAVALGYPLLASIRAIESGSKYHMKKLVVYWTLFSLFSLFEFAFVKIIEWIPFWSSVRFVVIFWLVMPRFGGSNHAYQGLVRPILVMKLQELIYMFQTEKEERILKRETLLDLVEKYIKKNGPEAVEKLIALERETESVGKSAAATSKQLNETEAVRRDTEMLEASERSAAATNIHQVLCAQSTSSVSRTDAVTFVKQTAPPEASADNSPKSPSLVENQQKWTCNLCEVTATSEKILNAHLQGMKHKSKIESLKASLLGAKDIRPSPLPEKQKSIKSPRKTESEGENAAATPKQVLYAQSTSSRDRTNAVVNVEETTPAEASADNRRPKTPPLKKGQQEWTCDLCKVSCPSGITFIGHLHGSKHKSKLQSVEASKLGATFAAPLHSETITSKVEAKEKAPSEPSSEQRHVRTPPLKQWTLEWTCEICNVRTTSEKTLNDHFKGSKHKAKLQSLDTCLVNADGKVLMKKVEISKYWCVVCCVKLLSDVDLAAHLAGKRHSSNLEAFIS